jgi:hypothetical protein
VEAPLSKVSTMKSFSESDHEFVARVALDANKLVGSYDAMEHRPV